VNTYNINALLYKDIDQYNYFYFYNSIQGTTLKKVIKLIKESLDRKPRQITIIYVNPIERNKFLKSGFIKWYYFLYCGNEKDKNNWQYGRKQYIDIYSNRNINYDKRFIEQNMNKKALLPI